jgi:hypothetical protein
MKKNKYRLYNDDSLGVNAQFRIPMADAYVQLVRRIEWEIQTVEELPSRGDNLDGVIGQKLIVMGMIRALEVIADAPDDISMLNSYLEEAEMKARNELDGGD